MYGGITKRKRARYSSRASIKLYLSNKFAALFTTVLSWDLAEKEIITAIVNVKNDL